MKKNGLYSIGEISKICNIPSSTLRYYDEIGVLKPCQIDEETGYRYYDRDALMYVPVLRYYQGWGMKLKEIVQLLERNDLTALKESFTGAIEQREKEIGRIVEEIDSIDSWRQLICETEEVIGEEKFQVTLKTIPPTKMFYLKPQISDYMSFENILINNEFCISLYNKGFVSLGPLYVVFPSEDQRFQEKPGDMTLLIKNHPHEDASPLVADIPGFTAVACYHRGLHNEIATTYEKIKTWAKEHNFLLRGDVIERYVIDYWSIKNKDWFLTEVYFPLQTKSS